MHIQYRKYILINLYIKLKCNKLNFQLNTIKLENLYVLKEIEIDAKLPTKKSKMKIKNEMNH